MAVLGGRCGRARGGSIEEGARNGSCKVGRSVPSIGRESTESAPGGCSLQNASIARCNSRRASPADRRIARLDGSVPITQ